MSLSDPPRMLDPRYGASEFGRSVLQQGLHCDPTTEQCARLRRRILPVIGAGAIVGSSLTAAGAASVLKLAAWFTGGVLAGGATLLFWTAGGADRHLDPAKGLDSTVARSLVESVQVASSSPVADTPAPTPEPVGSLRREPVPVATSTPAEPGETYPSSSGDSPLLAAVPQRDEVEILSRAVRALEQGRAAEALALTDDHMRLPTAKMSQERERIAIEALIRLGQREAARVRASQFSRLFPGSSYWPRIEGLVQGSPNPAGSGQSR